jgi:hypothetical protein
LADETIKKEKTRKQQGILGMKSLIGSKVEKTMIL